MAETAACLVRAVKAKKPQLAVLAGFAVSLSPALGPGTVVEVVTERIAGQTDSPVYETTGPDLELPPAAGITCCGEEQMVRQAETRTEEELPAVANTEGAAFMAVCEALGVACCEIRAVICIGTAPAALEEAAAALTETLTLKFGNNE